LDDPATDGNLDADVTQKECGAKPCHTSEGKFEESFFHALVVFVTCVHGLAIDFWAICPESPGTSDELNNGQADLLQLVVSSQIIRLSLP
jgi:hypothetical protein